MGHEKYAEVAQQYRVSKQIVAHLMAKAKKSEGFLRELLVMGDNAASRRSLIQEHVEELNTSRTVIDSVEQVLKSISQQHILDAKDTEVRAVMRDELGMRFRKIKIVSLHSNSEKNIVLR